MKKVIYTLLLSTAIALPSYASTTPATPPADAHAAPAATAAAVNPKTAKIEKRREDALKHCNQVIDKATADATAANLSGNWKMLETTYLDAANLLKKTLTDLTAPDNKIQVGHLDAACKKSTKEVEALVKHAPKTAAAPMLPAKAEKLAKKRTAAIEHCTKEIEKAKAASANLSGNWKTLADSYLAVANLFSKALADLATPDNKIQIGHLSTACHKSANEVEALAKHAPKAAATPTAH